MVLNIFTLLLLFLVLCFANGCLIFYLWWIIGQPSPVDHSTASFVEGRIFSQVGRKLADWYMQWGQKEEERIMDMAIHLGGDTEKQRQENYYNVSRLHRRPNPAKAFGVCPVCMGTYITLFVNIVALVVFAFFAGWVWAVCLSVPVLVYGWALSLTALRLFL